MLHDKAFQDVLNLFLCQKSRMRETLTMAGVGDGLQAHDLVRPFMYRDGQKMRRFTAGRG